MGVSQHNSPISDVVRADKLSRIGRRREPRTGLRGSRSTTYTPAERLWARVTKANGPDGCWEVQGWATHSGHVHISAGKGKPVFRAHRLAWELLNGPIPDGLSVLHRCDNARCVRPDHLFLGTQRDNVIDAVHKGRHSSFGNQKLNADQVREIRALWATGKYTQKAIGQRFGLKRNSISSIVNRKSWAHLD